MKTDPSIASYVDLHVVWLLVLLVPTSLFALPILWAFAAMAALPQGIILVRFSNLSKDQSRAKRHLFANELLLILVIALSGGGWYLFHSVR